MRLFRYFFIIIAINVIGNTTAFNEHQYSKNSYQKASQISKFLPTTEVALFIGLIFCGHG